MKVSAGKIFRRVAKEEDGVTIIETAIVVISMLLLMTGVIDFSRALYADIYIGYVAHSATRYAMVRGTTFTGTTCTTTATQNCAATSTDVVTYAKASAPLGIATGTDMTITPTWPGTGPTGACVTTNGTNSPGCLVKVQVTYNFRFALPFVSNSVLVLKSASSVTIVE
ncbi:Flp pilus assembly protein TadG [Granulicella aggregans]|uniref:Flp pilus assembly protein TadG n=2 Tax=Granulicella aggregans TaxID=474949 RepID=A0A7W8E307_9BACT|nr:TadE/TadG family type IV pilus assembly protein [Granulicella aggregans]MBB5057483.1 Flp pilus assembly protein TadG [Granulicella aggregans]